jgi:uncharacterized protein (TIRG00374 family)
MLKYLKIIISILLIYFLYSYGKIDPKLIDLSYSSIQTYVIAIGLIILTICLSAIRLFIVLNTLSVKVKFNYIFKITYIGHFFNHCLPGSTGGDLIKIFYLIKKYKFFNKAALISYIILDRLFGLAALFILFLISLYSISDFNENLLKLFYIFVTIAVAGSLLLFFILYLNIFSKIENKLKKYKNKFIILIKDYFKNIKNIKNFKYIDILKIFVISLIIFIFAIMAITLLSGSSLFTLENINTIGFASSVTFFANSIPISFNGLGIGEYVFSELSSIFHEKQIYHEKTVYFGNIFLTYRILLILSSLPGFGLFLIMKK